MRDKLEPSRLLRIWKVYLKNATAYRSKIWMSLLTGAVRVFLSILVYRAVFATKDTLVLSYSEAIFSITGCQLVYSLGLRQIGNSISKDIKSGQFEQFVIEPLHYLPHKLVEVIAGNFSLFLFSTLTFYLLAYLLTGIPNSELLLARVLLTLPLFLLQVSLMFFIYATIGVLAFWLQDVEPVYWIVDKFSMILGGIYLPVAFFPTILRVFAEFSPFGAMYFTTHIFNNDFLTRVPLLITVQLFYVTLFYFLLKSLYSKALIKLSINGG